MLMKRAGFIFIVREYMYIYNNAGALFKFKIELPCEFLHCSENRVSFL